MTRIRFIPAQVKTFPDERPDACKYCGSQILTQRSTADKTVTDFYEEKVTAVRCRRSDCVSAFRHCPEGVDRGGQTQRMRGWAALAWALGLSLRCASHLLAAFGVGDATLRRLRVELRVELSGKWRAPLCHRRPWTNNAAERAIERSEIRCKTVRGYKSEDWMLNGFGLTQWAWSGRDGLDMSEMVAA